MNNFLLHWLTSPHIKSSNNKVNLNTKASSCLVVKIDCQNWVSTSTLKVQLLRSTLKGQLLRTTPKVQLLRSTFKVQLSTSILKVQFLISTLKVQLLTSILKVQLLRSTHLHSWEHQGPGLQIVPSRQHHAQWLWFDPGTATAVSRMATYPRMENSNLCKNHIINIIPCHTISVIHQCVYALKTYCCIFTTKS